MQQTILSGLGSLFSEAAGALSAELVMFFFAALGYLIFSAVPLGGATRNKEDSKVASLSSEKLAAAPGAGEHLSQQMQACSDRGDHAGVAALWEQVRRGHPAPGVSLSQVVESLVALGRAARVIGSEVRQGLAQNAGLRADAEGVVALFGASASKGRREIIDEIQAALAGLSPPLDAHWRQAALEAALLAHLDAGDHEAVERHAAAAAQRGQQLGRKARSLILLSSVRTGGLSAAEVARRILNCAVAPSAFATLRSPLSVSHTAILLDAAIAECRASGCCTPLRELAIVLSAESKRSRLHADLPTDVLERALGIAVENGDTICCRELASFLGPRSGSAPRPPDLLCLIIQGIGCNDSAEATQLCELSLELAEFDVPMSDAVAEVALAAATVCGDGRTVSLIHAAVRRGKPSFSVCAALSRAYVACHLPGDACDVAEAMYVAGVAPDVNLRWLFLEAAAASGRVELAHAVAFPGRLPAGERRSKLLIAACSHAGTLEGAETVFSEALATAKAASTSVSNSLFSAMLQARAACGDYDGCAKLLAEVREMLPCSGDDPAGLRSLLRQLASGGQVDDAQRLLFGLGAKAGRAACHEVLQAMSLSQAWNIIDSLMCVAGPELSPNAATASIMLRAIPLEATSVDVERAFALAEGLEIRGAGDEVLATDAMSTCSRLSSTLPHALVRAEWWAARAYSGSDLGTLSPAARAVLIHLRGRSGDIVAAKATWAEARRVGELPHPAELAALADILASAGEFEEALLLVRAAPEAASCAAYSAILKGFSAGHPGRCWDIYIEMRQAGISPTFAVLNLLGCASARDSATRLDDVFQEIRRAGFKPDVVTYCMAVQGLCPPARSGSVQMKDAAQRALVLCQKARDSQIKIDEVTFNRIIDACADAPEVASQVLEEMRLSGVAASNYTLCSLVKVLGRQRLDDACAVFEELPKQQLGLQPNLQAYTCLISACCHACQHSRALRLCNDMIRRGVAPDVKTYSVLARGCLRAGDLVAADEVASVAQKLSGGNIVYKEVMASRGGRRSLNAGGGVTVAAASGLPRKRPLPPRPTDQRRRSD